MVPPPSSPDLTRRSWTKQFILGSPAAMSGPHWSAAVLADVASTGPGPGISGNFTAYIDATGSKGFFTVAVKLTPVL